MNIQGTEITAQRAKEFDLLEQQKGESDADFRARIAGALRDQGHLIEAHEAFNNALFDQSNDVMIGITGAVAQALQGKNYGRTGERQVDDDFAAGVISQAPQNDDALLLLAILLGGNRR